MMARVEVASREEAELIRRALADPELRALVKIVGALLPLRSRHIQCLTLQLAAAQLEAQEAEQERA